MVGAVTVGEMLVKPMMKLSDLEAEAEIKIILKLFMLLYTLSGKKEARVFSV